MKANDRDIGENSKSTYSIVDGDDHGMFEIVTDSQTQEGILRMKKVRPRNLLEISPILVCALFASNNIAISY